MLIINCGNQLISTYLQYNIKWKRSEYINLYYSLLKQMAFTPLLWSMRWDLRYCCVFLFETVMRLEPLILHMLGKWAPYHPIPPQPTCVLHALFLTQLGKIISIFVCFICIWNAYDFIKYYSIIYWDNIIFFLVLST